MTAKQTERFLVQEIVEALDIPYRDAHRIYHALVDALVKGLNEHKDVFLDGVGTVHPFYCKPRRYSLDQMRKYDPRYWEDHVDKPGFWKFVFRPSLHMKKILKENYLGPDILEKDA